MSGIDVLVLPILIGAVILCGSLLPLSRVLKSTFSARLRRAWTLLGIMVFGFIAGFLSIAAVLPADLDPALRGTISATLLCGGLFVYFAARLTEGTLEEVARLSAREKLALVDPLTGLDNRRSFDERLSEEIARSRRGGGSLALLMIDVDRFKDINDAFGHPVGDEVMRLVALALKTETRDGDVLARFGGDEFALIATGIDGYELTWRADRLCRACRAVSIPIGKRGWVDVTVSIGGALLAKDDSIADLIRRSDRLLYFAKDEGRDRAITSDADTPPRVTTSSLGIRRRSAIRA